MLCWARTVEKIVVKLEVKTTSDKLGVSTTPLRHMISGQAEKIETNSREEIRTRNRHQEKYLTMSKISEH